MALDICLIEPYFGGSHRAWAQEYRRFSRNRVQLLTLPAQFWKWRMQGGAVTLARLYLAQRFQPDLILATDMFDLSIFRALTRHETARLPIALYFHENQLTYHQNQRQRHGWQYGFINYASALAAEAIFFNSRFHMTDFFDELPRMLKHFGDYNELETVELLRGRAKVLPLGLDLRRFDAFASAVAMEDMQQAEKGPLIVWNHRWEADKNPEAFFRALYGLMDDGLRFRVALVGENFRQNPAEFIEARERLGERVVRYGYVESFEEYARLLWQADYVVSTAYQDFFGIAVAQAIYCGCVPLLPARLNYPDLLPAQAHSACLYHQGGLRYLLAKHLRGEVLVDRAPLQAHVAQFDWATMAPRYDEVLEEIVQACSASGSGSSIFG